MQWLSEAKAEIIIPFMYHGLMGLNMPFERDFPKSDSQ
jgi:hypothetical protein